MASMLFAKLRIRVFEERGQLQMWLWLSVEKCEAFSRAHGPLLRIEADVDICLVSLRTCLAHVLSEILQLRGITDGQGPQPHRRSLGRTINPFSILLRRTFDDLGVFETSQGPVSVSDLRSMYISSDKSQIFLSKLSHSFSRASKGSFGIDLSDLLGLLSVSSSARIRLSRRSEKSTNLLACLTTMSCGFTLP